MQTESNVKGQESLASARGSTATKRTRHERKMARNKRLADAALLDAQLKNQREEKRRNWEREHPVSAGLIPLVDYVPPR